MRGENINTIVHQYLSYPPAKCVSPYAVSYGSSITEVKAFHIGFFVFIP